MPPEVTGLDVDEFGVEELALAEADKDEVAFGVGFCVFVGVGVGVVVTAGVGVGVALQGVLIAWAVAFLPVALVFAAAEAVADADVVALLAGVPVALADAVLAGVVLAGVVLPPELVLLAGLVPLLAGLVTVAAGVAFWPAEVAVLEGDGGALDGHAGGAALARLLETLLVLAPPSVTPAGLPVPCGPGTAWLVGWEEEVNPTAEPICTKAARSGGNARATPMANTAQATARPDRSSPSCQSRGWRRV